MRSRHFIYGFLGNVGSSLVTSLLGFLSRTVFIYYLGAAYLGLGGLFANIFGLLSITELGLGNAITFSLYGPLARQEGEKISILMSVYRRAYQMIGSLIFVLGIGLYLFLDFFVAKEQQPADLGILYGVYLFSTGITYFFSYKTTLITADQRAYELIPLQMKYNTAMVVAQIGAILLWRSYLGYLLIQIGFQLALAIRQNHLLGKKYQEIDFQCKKKLPAEEKAALYKNIKGLFVLKIGDFCVNSTDQFLIVKFLSLSMAGVYSNYLLIRDLINTFIRMLFQSAGAGFGNVLAVETKERKRELFETMHFAAYWIYSLEAVCLLVLYQPFLTLWIGESYLLPEPVMALIVLNNYLTGMRIPVLTVKNAAGLFYQDRIVPYVFSAVNLAVSLVLVHYLGIAGIVLGTILGSLCFADWYRPYLLYRHIFQSNVRTYYRKYLYYFVLTLVNAGLSYGICRLFQEWPAYLGLAASLVVCLVIPNGVNILCFYKTAPFAYGRTLVRQVWRLLVDLRERSV